MFGTFYGLPGTYIICYAPDTVCHTACKLRLRYAIDTVLLNRIKIRALLCYSIITACAMLCAIPLRFTVRFGLVCHPKQICPTKSIVHCHISLVCCMQYSCFWRQGLVLCCIFPLLQHFSFAILLPGRNVVIDGRMLPRTDVKGIIIGQLVVN